MTFAELKPLIDKLNNSFKGKIIEGYNEYPVKEFLAAPQYIDRFSGFQLAYHQTLGNAERSLKPFLKDPLKVYVVFGEGLREGYNSESYTFKTAQDFILSNGIDLASL